MKIKNRRLYTKSKAVTTSSQEMGQNYGRVRMMPAEAATRRELSRWHGRRHGMLCLCASLEEVRVVMVSKRDIQRTSATEIAVGATIS